MPRSALLSTTVRESSSRFFGSGSGLWAKWPVGSQLSPTHSTPSLSSRRGIIMPPTEFTASRTTLKPALRIASQSTAGRSSTASIWRSVKSVSSTTPMESTSQKSKSSLSAQSSMACPSAAFRNSPFSLSSLSAFHCLGLCEAVSMMPPSASSNTTAISVVGVEAKPAFTTSTPQASRVPTTRFSTISPLIRASLPTTTL